MSKVEKIENIMNICHNVEKKLPDFGADLLLHNMEICDFYFETCNLCIITVCEPVIFLQVCCFRRLEVTVSWGHVTQSDAIRALKVWRVSSLKTLNCGSSIIDIDHWSRTNDHASREFLRPIKTDAIARYSMTLSWAAGLFTAFEIQRPSRRNSSSYLTFHDKHRINLSLLKLLVTL